jgi:hypothetical protein
MNKVDVDIYIAQLIKFFKDNPTDLNQIIGDLDSEKFYEEVKIQAKENLEKGDNVQLTQNQILNIVVKLSRDRAEKSTGKTFFFTKFGPICLN